MPGTWKHKLGTARCRAAVCGHHVAGHQRRPALDGLRQAPAEAIIRVSSMPRSWATWRSRRLKTSRIVATSTLAMAANRIEARTPAALAEARAMGRRRPAASKPAPRPANQPEVYAEQALWLRDHPTADLVLQAVRIGELTPGRHPQRGLRHHRPEAQGPVAASDAHEPGTGQRRRRIHPAARAALSGRIHHLARSHRGPGNERRTEDRRRARRRCSKKCPAARAAR